MKLNSPNLLLHSLLLGLLLVLTLPAQAQQPEEKANTCPNWQPNQLPTSQAQWQAEYQRLTPLFRVCLHSADFLAYYGAIQLRTGNANQALDTLERALLLNPNHGAAQLDYTQALLHTGDPYAAQALNKQLQKQANLPPLVRQQVNINQKQLNKLLNSFNHQLSLSTGYNSNLNSSPTSLTLNPIETLKPRSGSTAHLNLNTRYTQRQATSQQSLQLAINSRLTENNQDNQHQLTTSYQHQSQLLSGNQLKHQLTLLGLNHGGSHIYTSLEAQQQWQTTNNNTCQLSPSHSLSYHRFPHYNNLDALEYRLTPEASCQLNRHQIKLSASGLYNHALSNNRPGSHRHGLELTASWQHPLGKGSLVVQGRQTHWQDQDYQGYFLQQNNTLIYSNAKRTIKRQQLALVYLLPLSPSLQLSSQASWQQQTSNLELFEFKSHQLELGLRWYF